MSGPAGNKSSSIPKLGKKFSRLTIGLHWVVFLVLYYGAAKLGFSLAYVAEQVTVVWAPTGLSIGLLALFGRSYWPAVFAGAFLANVTTNEPIITALLIGAGNTLEALAAVSLLERIAGYSWRMHRVRDAVAFIGGAAMLSPVVSATMGSAALCGAGLQSWSNVGNVWFVWWLGDALGAMIVAPAILASSAAAMRVFARRFLEATALVVCILLLVVVLFQHVGDFKIGHLPYLTFPLLIWAAFRFGPAGAAISTFFIAVITVWQTSRGLGPFASGRPADDLVSLQLFMATLSTTSLIFAAAMMERREQHLLLRAVTEGSTDAIFVKDRQGRYLTINAAGVRAIGRPVEEIIGTDDSQLFPPDSAQALIERDRFIMASGTASTEEETVPTNGQSRTFLTMKAPYIGDTEEVLGVIGIARDITESKRTEIALQKEYELRRAIEQSVRAGITGVDPEGTQTFSNRAFCEMVGWSEDELVGARAPFVYWPAAETVRIQQALESAMAGQSPPEGFELRFRRRNGEIFPVQLALSALLNESGGVRWWIASVHDISSQVRIREALAHSEERYRSLVLATAQVVWHGTAEGIVTHDPSWTAFTGQPADKARGQGWLAVVHPDDIPNVVQRWQECLRGRLPYETELRLRVSDGSYRYVHARAVPVLDRSGDVREWVGTLTDINERKTLERKQAQLLEVEQERNQRKDDFLAMLAHELRNPLAPIVTAVAILEVRPTDDVFRRSIAIVDRQVKHLTRIVDDLLDVARISRGAIQLRSEFLDLCPLVLSVCDDIKPVLVSREQEFDLAVPSQPLMVLGDRTRLEQVVTNLLQNASKYTPRHGAVSVSVMASGSTAVIRIRDTGIGISKEFLPQVFDLFSQEDRSLDRSSGGLGLGLNIAQSIVRLHGGKMSASSEGAGQGAEFTITLPLAIGESSAEQQREPAGRGSLRIMVVEDNEDAAEVLEVLLSLEGHEVRTFSNAYDALKSASEFEPQVILLDIGLPGMNGYEAAPKLRAVYNGKQIRIAALSGYGRPEDRENSAAAGFDAHLLKPADPDALMRLLQEWSWEV